jgi:hypothetical protein
MNNVYQLKAGSHVISKFHELNDTSGGGAWYSKIFTLHTPGKKIYLGYWQTTYSSSGTVQGIKLFTIENNGLNDSVQLIKTKTGLHNELYFEFDFFSVADRDERPVELIYFDEKNKTIKIPVVNESLKVTGKFITYKYDGQYFVKQSK